MENEYFDHQTILVKKVKPVKKVENKYFEDNFSEKGKPIALPFGWKILGGVL